MKSSKIYKEKSHQKHKIGSAEFVTLNNIIISLNIMGRTLFRSRRFVCVPILENLLLDHVRNGPLSPTINGRDKRRSFGIQIIHSAAYWTSSNRCNIFFNDKTVLKYNENNQLFKTIKQLLKKQ